MKEKKLTRLFDFYKFEGNTAMGFAIQTARSYIASLQKTVTAFELNDEELDMVSAAGLVDSGTVLKNKPPRI
ncbi:MAG: hypothetical protein IJP90_09100 [Treponema sp.]|nr:hypothetical protein [Treponema sp.]